MTNLAQASFTYNNYGASDVDRLETYDTEAKYRKVVDLCRFFYKKDPIAGIVVDRQIDIAINDLMFEKGKLSENEYRLFMMIKPKLLEFAENCALEYLISGLVVPEVEYRPVDREQLKEYGVKKYEYLVLPEVMWLRDPNTIVIKDNFFMDKPSYFVEINKEIMMFIQSDGYYSDGTSDLELLRQIKELYPEFYTAVKKGVKILPLENNSIIRRRVVKGSCYPTPYMDRSLEALKHKRNLRRMDYSIASRVISAIQLFKLGDKDFPVVQGDEEQFEAIKSQMNHRGNNSPEDVERIFQMFANHTLQVEWVFPPTDALLSDAKYKEPNADIFLGLGFPRILTTGETDKTGTSDPEFASIPALKSMEKMRKDILVIIQKIVTKVAQENNFKSSPIAKWKPIHLIAFKAFIDGMTALYDTGNLSRTTYTDSFGYDYQDEVELRKEEQDQLDDMGLSPIAARPFAANNTPGQENKPKETPVEKKPEQNQ